VARVNEVQRELWLSWDEVRDIVEQMEQIQDEARGHHEEGLKEKGVFQYVFQMFHLCDEAIAGGAFASLVATCEDL